MSPTPSSTAQTALWLGGTAKELVEFWRWVAAQPGSEQPKAKGYATAVARILSAAPDTGLWPVGSLDLGAIARQFGEENPAMSEKTLATYVSKARRARSAYLLYIKDPERWNWSGAAIAQESDEEPETIPDIEPTPGPEEHPSEAAPAARPHRPSRAARRDPSTRPEVALPGGRAVGAYGPTDLTAAEGRAAAGVLALFLPTLFPAPDLQPAAPAAHGQAWTLVYWPDADTSPVALRVSGPSLRAALEAYIVARHPDYPRDSDEALDRWFATEALACLVFEGHHAPRDIGEVLNPER